MKNRTNVVCRPLTVVCLLLAFFCSVITVGKSMASGLSELNKLTTVSSADWERLQQSKIFFGHQSVGNNIIKGLEDIGRQFPRLRLNIAKTIDPGRFISPIFAHNTIGVNTDPYSKIQDFDKIIHQGIGIRADIVFFKFCFVDIVRDTNLDALFTKYKNVVRRIQHDYPHLTVLHCTVPLQVHRPSWKTYVKNALHFTSLTYTDNVRRNEYNSRLLREYGKQGTVFDLALFEATRQDGGTVKFTGPGGKEYLALNPSYSSDGAHLNATGSKFVAQQLLLFLVKVTR